ncbi:MAG: hypothetical protein AAF518_16620 [Spirochaetota bacterium]
MKNKDSALKRIVTLMRTFDIAIDDIEAALKSDSADEFAHSQDKGGVAKTLFSYLGGIFIFAGISTYVTLFWHDMNLFMRVFVTLGIGYILLFVLVSTLYEKKYPKLITPLTLLSAVFMTGGWFVFFEEIAPIADEEEYVILIILGIQALHQAAIFTKYRETVLVLTSIIFWYGFLNVALVLAEMPLVYIAITLGASLFLVGNALEKTTHRALSAATLLVACCWLNVGLFDLIVLRISHEWAAVIVGVSLMLTAFGLQQSRRYPRLISMGFLGGSVLLYSALFALIENSPYEILFIGLTVSMLYACIVFRSKALLFSTVAAMLSFIAYYSAEHFADSLGWPLTLILLGIIFLGVGALALNVKKQI